MMPSVFISHGAPNRVMGQSPAKKFLESFAESINTPKAIVIFSAHWFSKELQITAETLEAEHGSTVQFLDAYNINYHSKQPKWLSERISDLLEENNQRYTVCHRALDHGAWSVLMLCYPNAEIPVIGMSLPVYDDFHNYFVLGKMLKVLRKEDILIIGSGSATHNLSTLSHSKTAPDWAIEFVRWLQDRVDHNDYEALTNLYQSHPFSRMAHPTFDHYVPLLVAAGAAAEEPNELIHDSYEYGSLNNSCFKFGSASGLS